MSERYVAIAAAAVLTVVAVPVLFQLVRPTPPERPELQKYFDHESGVLCYVVDSQGSGIWCVPTREPVKPPAGSTP